LDYYVSHCWPRGMIPESSNALVLWCGGAFASPEVAGVADAIF
jgi:hypothetical protein